MADKRYNLKMTLTDGTEFSAGVITAPQGPTGPTGPQGPQGEKGEAGVSNVKVLSSSNTWIQLPEDYTSDKYIIVGTFSFKLPSISSIHCIPIVINTDAAFTYFLGTGIGDNNNFKLCLNINSSLRRLYLEYVEDFTTHERLTIDKYEIKIVLIGVTEQ